MLTVATVKGWFIHLIKGEGMYARMFQDLTKNDQWEELVVILNENRVRDCVDFVIFVGQNW